MITILSFILFFFNDTATTEIYTLSLHDALPISAEIDCGAITLTKIVSICLVADKAVNVLDRKSTRLNSSHMSISYAVFCLKKKKKRKTCQRQRTRECSGKSNHTLLWFRRLPGLG